MNAKFQFFEQSLLAPFDNLSRYMASQGLYHPLDVTRREIRLLEIDDGEDITCRLVTVSLHD
jgi:hypothetical protein